MCYSAELAASSVRVFSLNSRAVKGLRMCGVSAPVTESGSSLEGGPLDTRRTRISGFIPSIRSSCAEPGISASMITSRTSYDDIRESALSLVLASSVL